MSVTYFEQWYAGSLKIRGYEPVSASGLPVYVYFSGTGTSNTRTAELEFPRQMALRDYVSAKCSCQYKWERGCAQPTGVVVRCLPGVSEP